MVVLTLLAAPGRHSKPPAVCMLHSSGRLSVCPGQAVIQTQELGSFSSNRHTKNGGAKGIRTRDLLHAMQHDSVRRRRAGSGYRRSEPLYRLEASGAVW